MKRFQHVLQENWKKNLLMIHRMNTLFIGQDFYKRNIFYLTADTCCNKIYNWEIKMLAIDVLTAVIFHSIMDNICYIGEEPVSNNNGTKGFYDPEKESERQRCQ